MPSETRAENGHCFVWAPREAMPLGDCPSAPKRSGATLWENGGQIGPGHQMHDDIRALGGGRFSHWGSVLYFSTSDHTDPRTNGRTYVLRLTTATPAQMAWAVAGSALALWLLLRDGCRLWRWLTRFGLAVVGGAGGLVFGSWLLHGLARGRSPAATVSAWPEMCRVGLHESTAVLAVALAMAVVAAMVHAVAQARQCRGRFPAASARARSTWYETGATVSKYGVWLSLAMAVLLLARCWAAVPGPSVCNDHAFTNTVVGYLPFADAHGYYSGAESLMHSGWLDEWNTRRPINACFLAGRTWATGGDHGWAMVLMTALVGWSSWYFADRIGRRFGWCAGLAGWALLMGAHSLYLGTFLSESLGAVLGALATGLLLSRAVAPGALRWQIAAVGAFGLACAARAGLQLVAPAVGLGVALIGGGGVSAIARRGLAMAFVVLMAHGWSDLLNTLYFPSRVQANANFAHTLCGLARGTDWSEAYRTFLPHLQKLTTQEEQARLLYAQAWVAFRDEPLRLFRGLWRNLAFCATSSPENLIAPVVPAWLTAWLAVLPARTVVGWVVLFVALIRLRSVVRGHDAAMLGLAWLGVLASAAFVYGDGAWRVMAPGFALVAATAAGLVVCRPVRFGTDRELARRGDIAAVALIVLVAGGAVAGPILWRSSTPPAWRERRDHRVLPYGRFVINTGTWVQGARLGDQPLGGGALPVVSPAAVKQYLAYAPAQHALADVLSWMASGPVVLGAVYDYRSRSTVQLVAPPHLYGASAAWLIVDAARVVPYWRVASVTVVPEAVALIEANPPAGSP